MTAHISWYTPQLQAAAIDILIEAASQVGPALFFSLLIITVSFMPIFTLESQEGRLFSPLAFTKTFSMAAAALLSITLVPALMIVCVRGRIVPEHKNPINRFLIWIYRPVIAGVMRAKAPVILDAPVSGTVVEHGLPTLALGLQSINGNLNIDWNADDKATHHFEFAKDSHGKPLGLPAGLSSGGTLLDFDAAAALAFALSATQP